MKEKYIPSNTNQRKCNFKVRKTRLINEETSIIDRTIELKKTNIFYFPIYPAFIFMNY